MPNEETSSVIVPDSTYPQLEHPAEFKSQIPEHLLVDVTPTDRYIMEQMSIMKQGIDWSVNAHLSTDRNVRKTNGRLIRAEAAISELKEDKKFLASGWKALVIVGGVISGFISFAVMVWQALGKK